MPSKAAGAVVQGVGHRPDVHVVVADHLTVEKDPAIGVARPRPCAWGKLSFHYLSA